MRIGKKRYFYELKYGQSRCFRCGHKFGKDEHKFFMYPPLVGGEQVCAKCKQKEAKP